RDTRGPTPCLVARSRGLSNTATIATNRIGGPNEDHDTPAGAVTRRVAARGPGRPASGGGESAVHHGVLLQGAVGASAGVSPAVPEEPLPAAPKGSGDGTAVGGEDRDAGKSHDGGGALGLPGHPDVQEFRDGDNIEPGRAGADQAALAGSGNVHARRTAPVRGPVVTLGSASDRHYAGEKMTPDAE